MVKNYIIISDIHMGGHSNCEPNLPELFDFLEWVRDIPSNGRLITIQCEKNEKTITIEPITELILLGDILDLWDPRDQDRNRVVEDSTKFFSLLHEIKCNKVYVTGNHDEDIGEISRNVKSFGWKDEHKLYISERHYPPGNEIKTGIEINGLRYSFLHGHQYDREQITYTLSQILNTRFDPIDFFQDLANVSFTKKISKSVSITILMLWFAFIWVNIFPSNLIKDIIGIVFGTFGIILLSHYYLSSQHVIRDRNVSNWFGYIFLIPIVGLILILVAGIRYNQVFSFLFSVSFYILTYLVLVSIIPRTVTSSMRVFYNKFLKSKDKTAEEVIKEDYFDLKKDTIDADVVVFGHTHRASAYLPQADELVKNKLFINTGCWVKEKNRNVNTFLYIDSKGIYLLKWAGGGRIDCISHFVPQDILKHLLKK